jgi:hypothetical protein
MDVSLTRTRHRHRTGRPLAPVGDGQPGFDVGTLGLIPVASGAEAVPRSVTAHDVDEIHPGPTSQSQLMPAPGEGGTRTERGDEPARAASPLSPE